MWTATFCEKVKPLTCLVKALWILARHKGQRTQWDRNMWTKDFSNGNKKRIVFNRRRRRGDERLRRLEKCRRKWFGYAGSFNPFTTNGTIRPKNIFEVTVGINTHLTSTVLYPSGIATHYASCHVIKFHAIESFFESSLFSPTNSQVSFQFLGLVSCGWGHIVKYFIVNYSR